MAWNALRAYFEAKLPTNNVNQISALDARDTFNELTDIIGVLDFKGIATPVTTPTATDGVAMYIAIEAGTYTNFDGLIVSANELTFLTTNDGTSWTKSFITLSGFDASTLVEHDSLVAAKTALGANKIFIASVINDETAPHRTLMITEP